MLPLKEFNPELLASPFDHLGCFQTAKRDWLIRLYLPDVSAAELIDEISGASLGLLRPVHAAGLFELNHQADQAPLYRVRILQPDLGLQSLDAYQFKQRAEVDLSTDRNRLYLNLGAQLCAAQWQDQRINGVRFAVYAPNAASVNLIGDFNHWHNQRHAMQRYEDGVWRLFIPEAGVDDEYCFLITDSAGNRLPTKTDPYNFSCTQHPDFHSVVINQQSYDWQDHSWQTRQLENVQTQAISIYEVHLGSWCQPNDQQVSYRALAEQLIPYVKRMGFTHIELLPITEHPFDGSWGYQPIGLFAPTSRYGTVDQFKAFIDQCHQHGIAVLLDWVPAHFPADNHGLAKFDGSALYEYADPRQGWHPDWNSYVYDYSSPEVCAFLISSALFWLDVFHIDGLRVDAVSSMLYLDYSRQPDEWLPNADGGNHNYDAIAFLQRLNKTINQHYPKALKIAEESSYFQGVTKTVTEQGLGFDLKWNLGWMNDSLAFMAEPFDQRAAYREKLTHAISYMDSEHFLLPLSHDEVTHGKGSLLDRMPGDQWQKMANLRAYYGFMYAHPGKKLMFMGNEFAHLQEWSHQSALDWSLLGELPTDHSGMQTLIKDLNQLYLQQPALHELDSSKRGFSWLTEFDNERLISSFIRRAQGEDVIVVVVNLSIWPVDNYRVGVPHKGCYRVILDTDSRYYNGSNYGRYDQYQSLPDAVHGQPMSLNLSVPPLATLYLKWQGC
ncbi:1,4-alpha-glucan branching protein GlgB [Reinekea thalattae]|uniref:1,4-alpha-glucan branching enzyme GlgB n=1 Tax=Reinekea thalattae TaxID=2593301 RepID=A0A5C8Z279_9GAMM|nr:1,4-alpha-glucan branching protein GlgB [Reinekea thalattae]TXR51331.1 1,4-alpha-glucan branching protein GlgB [Reinekea thalattae]